MSITRFCLRIYTQVKKVSEIFHVNQYCVSVLSEKIMSERIAMKLY
jgi:hypothetical protein